MFSRKINNKKTFKLTKLFFLSSFLSACVTPFPEALQGTSKTSYSEDKAQIPNLKLPLKLKYNGTNGDLLKRTLGETHYLTLSNSFHVTNSDEYLEVDVSVGTASFHMPETKMDYTTNTYKMINKKSVVKYAAINAPSGEELAEYKCDVEVTATTVSHMQDLKRFDSPTEAINELFSLAEHNCWADLVEQMIDDIDQIKQWNEDY